jgi:hypothetical protein
LKPETTGRACRNLEVVAKFHSGLYSIPVSPCR